MWFPQGRPESPIPSPATAPIVALVGAADSNMAVNWMDSSFISKIIRSMLRKKLKSQVEKTRPPAEGLHHHLRQMVGGYSKKQPGWLSGKESACQCRRQRKWVQSLSPLEKIPWRRKWQPTPVSCPGNPMDRGAWVAPVHGVAAQLP